MTELTTEKDILEIIKKGAEIGYSATVRYGGADNLIQYQVVAITEMGIFAMRIEIGVMYDMTIIYSAENMEIIGWKYAGSLLGSGDVPLGTLFDTREANVVKAVCVGQSGNEVDLELTFSDGSGGSKFYYHKETIAPIF